MANGIVRKIDNLGRITLPVEVRRRYGILTGDRVGLHLDGNIIRLSKDITGMSRPVDELGRVALPMEYRKTLGINPGDGVDMWVEGEEICLRKEVTGCIICGSAEQLLEVEGIHICRSCGLKIVDKVMEG